MGACILCYHVPPPCTSPPSLYLGNHLVGAVSSLLLMVVSIKAVSWEMATLSPPRGVGGEST